MRIPLQNTVADYYTAHYTGPVKRQPGDLADVHPHPPWKTQANHVADTYPFHQTGKEYPRRTFEAALGAEDSSPRSIYDPSTYPSGVPNPYGPRVHAWNGGPWDQGTRYHGAIYDRPQATFPWHERPLWSGGTGIDALGDTEPPDEFESKIVNKAYNTMAVVYGVLSLAGTAAGAYHGYKRNDSVGWAFGWAIFGSMLPVFALPVMVAQGFGEKKRK